MVPKKKFVFSTDSYDIYSVKAQEIVRPGSSQQFRIDGPASRKPPDMKIFFKNDQNKEQLCDQLLRVKSSEKASSRIKSCSQLILIVKGRAHKLTVVNGKATVTEIHELYSNQEETDTRIIMYLHYVAKQGFKSAVVRSPDSDIFIMLYYVSAVACSLGKEYCDAL